LEKGAGGGRKEKRGKRRKFQSGEEEYVMRDGRHGSKEK